MQVWLLHFEDTRVFHRRSSRTPGLEESEADSQSDVHNEDSDKSERAERPAEDPSIKASLIMFD